PDFVGGVRVGQGVPVEIVLTPGDGRKLTVDEIKKAAAGGNRPAGGSSAGSTSPAGGGESAVDKAKLEELKKKNAEIEQANAVINRTCKAGNEALNAANVASRAGNRDQAVQKYSDAVTAYDEGLGADPDQPAILTNKAAALKGRGVERYNGAIKSTDDAGKTAALEQAKGDFKAAAEASSKAATLIKAQTAPSDPTDVQRYNSNKYAAFLTNAESMRLFVTKVDGTQAEAGLTAFRDYIAVETDPAKKSKAQLDAAQMLLDAGAADKALAEFQAILATQPDSPEAN